MDGNVYVGTAALGCPPSASSASFPLRHPKTTMAQSPKACATNFSLYFQNIKSAIFNRQAFEKYFRPEMSNLAQKPREKDLDKILGRTAYPASSATPLATNTTAIHRLRSTLSCRKIFAANAFPINVSEAAAGATRLTSPHDKANSRLKKATAIAVTPRKKLEFDSTRPTTVHTPERFTIACTSPTCFIARAIRMSPTTEKNTTTRIPLHV